MGLQARYVNGAVALLAIGAVMVVVLGGSAQSEAGNSPKCFGKNATIEVEQSTGVAAPSRITADELRVLDPGLHRIGDADEEHGQLAGVSDQGQTELVGEVIPHGHASDMGANFRSAEGDARTHPVHPASLP